MDPKLEGLCRRTRKELPEATRIWLPTDSPFDLLIPLVPSDLSVAFPKFN